MFTANGWRICGDLILNQNVDFSLNKNELTFAPTSSIVYEIHMHHEKFRKILLNPAPTKLRLKWLMNACSLSLSICFFFQVFYNCIILITNEMYWSPEIRRSGLWSVSQVEVTDRVPRNVMSAIFWSLWTMDMVSKVSDRAGEKDEPTFSSLR